MSCSAAAKTRSRSSWPCRPRRSPTGVHSPSSSLACSRCTRPWWASAVARAFTVAEERLLELVVKLQVGEGDQHLVGDALQHPPPASVNGCPPRLRCMTIAAGWPPARPPAPPPPIARRGAESSSRTYSASHPPAARAHRVIEDAPKGLPWTLAVRRPCARPRRGSGQRRRRARACGHAAANQDARGGHHLPSRGGEHADGRVDRGLRSSASPSSRSAREMVASRSAATCANATRNPAAARSATSSAVCRSPSENRSRPLRETTSTATGAAWIRCTGTTRLDSSWRGRSCVACRSARASAMIRLRPVEHGAAGRSHTWGVGLSVARRHRRQALEQWSGTTRSVSRTNPVDPNRRGTAEAV